MRIALVSSEVTPLSKSGGLGDMVAALAAALSSAGHEVLTVSPRYGTLPPGAAGAEDTGVSFGIHAGGARHDVRYLRVVEGDVHHLLIDHYLFDRSGLYGDSRGTFGDNHLRFSVLARAAIEAPRRVPIRGELWGEDVLLHAHDWQAALVPVYLEHTYRPLGLFASTPSVLTVHNLQHQGRFAPGSFADLELVPRVFSAEGLEWHGDVNLLKGGLLTADELTTVSPTHAVEISTPEYGFGLDGLIRERSAHLTGILNGIDTEVWDPATDPFLAEIYDADDLQGKARCKAALQAELGLPVDASAPLVGSVGRLDPQKGVELLIESIPWLAQRGAQVVVVGTAAPAYARFEERLRALERVWPRNVRAIIAFSEAMAHRVEAGSDLFAMPSRFEPCGLNQMISLRYGAVPVVRSTGGLADTIQCFDPVRGTGNGWTFEEPSGWAFREALHWALVTWRDHPGSFEALRRRGMLQDVTWGAAVPRFEEVYARGVERRR